MNSIDPTFSNRLARSRAELDQAYALRYRAYLSQSHIDPNHSERFSDEFDGQVNCFTYLLHDSQGDAVGSIRACVRTGDTGWNRIPAETCFGTEIAQLLCEKSRVVELNRFVLSPEMRGASRRAKLALFHNAVHVADTFQCEYMLAAVRGDHVTFYEQLLFEVRSEERRYHGVKFSARLMLMNWTTAAAPLRQHRVFQTIEHFVRDDQGFAGLNTGATQ